MAFQEWKLFLPSLLSAHGLLQILMVYNVEVLLLNFFAGLLLEFNNECQPAYLFIYLFTFLLIFSRANKFHKNCVS